MAETAEILIFMIEESWREARQTEDQRTSITNIIIIIASIIQAALTQTGFRRNALPLSILLIILGIYGALASVKLYERFVYNVDRVGEYVKKLDELYPEADIRKILRKTHSEHHTKHPILATKIRLNRIWLGLHILIALLGVTYTLVILTR